MLGLFELEKEDYQDNSYKEFVKIYPEDTLSVGDTLELLIPGEIDALEFKIDELWHDETLESIPTVNPGKAEQKVVLKIPEKVEEGWILRRKK